MNICETCGEIIEKGFDDCWKCAVTQDPEPTQATEPRYKNCIACGSEKLGEAFLRPKILSIHSSGEVEIVSRERDDGLTFLPPKTSSSVDCFVCGDCGYVALFADKHQAIYKAYLGGDQG
ncbi:MAG: hypothetical protein HOH33_12630 [Verrucomicrobia bacterium]|jgi:hypothetical protein|nr:hypothetical protein [Verrucomicrobiota bacterium]